MGKYLIIGGSSGIGKALTTQLAKEGHEVIATYNKTSPEPIEHVEYHALDMMTEAPETDFIPNQLDGLTYCPGSINLKPFGRFSAEDFRKDYELQVVGAVKIIQASLQALKAANKSSIVLFSTVAVQNGFNFHSQVASSKGAIEGLARSLAAEFAPKIRVNCIAPSLTDTPLASALLRDEEKKKANADRHPLKAIGTPEDIARSAVYLLTPDSAWVTGQILHVDGGMSSIRG